jgi:hypothetical protein
VFIESAAFVAHAIVGQLKNIQNIMSTNNPFPSFDERLSFLNDFIIELVEAYQAGKIDSWSKLDRKVKRFFTSERTKKMEELVPGWKKMASYSTGITQTHVTCVFLGVFMLPEFQSLSLEEQQLAKWIVLFHDLAKVHLPKKRDTMHGFRSGILAAKILPNLGFSITDKYHDLLQPWSEFTGNACIEGDIAPIPDNQKLPEILAGIDQMFGANAPASRIVKIVLLHISLTIDPNYQAPAPLTDDEIKRYITPELYPLLKVMMMGDNEGWSLFEPQVRKQQYNDAIDAFDKVH